MNIKLFWQSILILVIAPLVAVTIAMDDDSLKSFIPNIFRALKIWYILGFVHLLNSFGLYENAYYYQYRKKNGSTGPAAFYWKYPGKRYVWSQNIIKHCHYPFFISNKTCQEENHNLYLAEIAAAKRVIEYRRNHPR